MKGGKIGVAVGQLHCSRAEVGSRVSSASRGNSRDLAQHLGGVDAVRASVRLQHVVVGQRQRLSSEEREQTARGSETLQ